MVYKSLNGLAPEYMRSMFIYRDTVYSLRDAEGKLNIPKPRTNYLKNSFSYTGAVLWNSLPVGLRQAKTLQASKPGCGSRVILLQLVIVFRLVMHGSRGKQGFIFYICK